MSPAVFDHHEFHHRGQATAFLFRSCDQCGLYVRWNSDTDDFGFCDGQRSTPVCKTLAFCQSVSGYTAEVISFKPFVDERVLNCSQLCGHKRSGASRQLIVRVEIRAQ